MPIFTIVLKEHFSMKRTSFILIWLLLLVLSSCTVLETRRTLNTIEGLVHNYPDSAWSKVNEINNADLKTKHLQAYYALLYSVAADKTYHDFTSDSIARIAVNYYDTKGSDRHRMLAWYSLGRVQINAEQWTSAIISLTEALSSAESIDDSFYQGLIHRNLASVYRGVYDNTHALIEIDKAIDSFESAGRKPYLDYSLLDKMIYLYGNRKGEEALYQADELINDSSIDPVLRGLVVLNQARILSSMNLQSNESVIEKYKKASTYPNVFLTPLDYSNIAYAYSLSGFRDSVDYYLEVADSMSVSRQSDAEVSFNKYKIAKIGLPTQKVIDLFANTMYYEDSLIHVKLNNSVSYALNDYHCHKLRTNAIQVENQRLVFLSVILIAILIIFVLIMWYRKSRRDLDNALEVAADLNDNLAILGKYRDQLQMLVINQYRDKLYELNYLSKSYLYWEVDNFKKEQRKGEFATEGEILERFRSQLRELKKNTSMLVKLEEEVDACNDYVISKLRKDAGQISERGKQFDETDYQLITLFLSGFENRQVAFLSNVDYDVVRKRKSRLFIKLNQLGTSSAIEILIRLGKKGR